MVDSTPALVSSDTASGRLMTLETVPTETPASFATSLIPTAWARNPLPRQSEVDDAEGGRRGAARLPLVHERQHAVLGEAGVVHDDLAEGVQPAAVEEGLP